MAEILHLPVQKKGKKPREVVLRQEEMRDTGASSLLNSLSGTF